MVDGADREKNLYEKTQTCPTILTLSLLANDITTLDYLEATPLVLVSGIFKVPLNGRYLTPSIVGALIYTK